VRRLLCKLFGHRLPTNDLLVPERYRRCERCGGRVLVSR
jgi:DNA-directed RNA polymerase subunit RPC12/RpoP